MQKIGKTCLIRKVLFLKLSLLGKVILGKVIMGKVILGKVILGKVILESANFDSSSKFNIFEVVWGCPTTFAKDISSKIYIYPVILSHMEGVFLNLPYKD